MGLNRFPGPSQPAPVPLPFPILPPQLPPVIAEMPAPLPLQNTALPEPQTLAMLIGGLALMGAMTRRRKAAGQRA